jgi:Cellulase (glycosyl hydrolase family 5)
VSRIRPTSEDLKPSRTTLLRQQLQERRRAERADLSPLPQNRQADARTADVREEQPPSRWMQLRAESQVAENRASQLKEEERVARQTRVAERATHEEALQAAAEKQRQHEQAQARAGAVEQERKLSKQRRAEARAQNERDQPQAISQRKEQEAASVKPEQEVLRSKAQELKKETLKSRRIENETVRNRPVKPEEPRLVQPQPPARDEEQSAESEASLQRQQAELRAINAKQTRIEKQQQRERAEAEATMRRDQRRGQQQPAVTEAPLEAAEQAETAPREKKSVHTGGKREDNAPSVEPRRRQAPGLSLTPRGISSAGSASRETMAAPAAGSGVSQQSSDVAPFLRTQGSFIIDLNGDAVTLRGITVTGLDTVAPQTGQSVPNALALDPRNLATITNQWGANLVRLPFTANTILNGNGTLTASDLLAGLDLTVAAIADAGAYVLLALESAAGTAPSDANTIQVWETLAARYQGEPRVFYEVFASSSPITGNLASQLTSLIATVRQENPGALIFVPGSANGLDVSSVPLRDATGSPAQNVVYAIAASAQNVPNPDLLTAVSSAYPVFASAWSDDGSDLGRQASHVADLFERCGIGWAAANWNNAPALVMDAAGGDFTPTIWGDVVQRAIKLTAPPLLEPADAPVSLSTLRAGSPRPSRLSTLGNFILNDSRVAIALRGVTVAGMDIVALASGQTLSDALSIDENNLALMTGTWGLNLVRLPFLAQTVLNGNGPLSAGEILAGLDLTVALISNAGAYALLALEAPVGASLPDASTQQVWQNLAKRYNDEPGVLYEIFASPGPLGSGWFQNALSLIGTIRQQNSAAMIFVNVGNNGADFTGLPLLLPTGAPIYNVVYAVNISPQNGPGPDDGPLASFADANPVFVSTWSDDAANPSRITPYVADFFGRHSIGWAAANWNADPRLVVDAGNRDFTPTAWGLIAGRAAKLPVQPRLKPF